MQFYFCDKLFSGAELFICAIFIKLNINLVFVYLFCLKHFMINKFEAWLSQHQALLELNIY